MSLQLTGNPNCQKITLNIEAIFNSVSVQFKQF